MGVARKWGCDRGLRLTLRRLDYAGSTGGFTVAGVRWEGTGKPLRLTGSLLPSGK